MTQSKSESNQESLESSADESAPAKGRARAWKQIQLGGTLRQWGVVASILLALTAVSAIAHGYFSNRWIQRSGLAEVGTTIDNMSQESLPSWDFVEEVEISEGVMEMLQTTGHVSRRYELKSESGRPAENALRITVAVFVGSPGRITAHDPQVCYSAVDYTGIGTRRHIAFEDTEGISHEFWTMTVSQKEDPNHSVIVSHAWGTDGTCSAAEYPRLAYLGEPYLYKIQLAMAGGPSTRLDENLSIEFLKEFLPLLRRTIQQAQP